jgi:hypothetical protein
VDATGEAVLVVGLAWVAFKGVITVLLLLGAGPVLRRTPLAPVVVRFEAHPWIAQLRSRLPWPRRAVDPSGYGDPGDRPSQAT